MILHKNDFKNKSSDNNNIKEKICIDKIPYSHTVIKSMQDTPITI